MRMTIERLNEYFIDLINDFIQERISIYEDDDANEHDEEDRIDSLREKFFNSDFDFGFSHDDVSDRDYLQLLVWVCKESKNEYDIDLHTDKFLKREEIIQMYAYFLSRDDRVKWDIEECMITMK